MKKNPNQSLAPSVNPHLYVKVFEVYEIEF